MCRLFVNLKLYDGVVSTVFDNVFCDGNYELSPRREPDHDASRGFSMEINAL